MRIRKVRIPKTPNIDKFAEDDRLYNDLFGNEIPDFGDVWLENEIAKNKFEPMSPKDLSDEPY